VDISLSVGDVQIEVFKVGPDEAKEYGGVGWFFDDSRTDAVGPFATPAQAIRAVADRLEAGAIHVPE
jgi:hypothetical protein